MSVNLLPSEAKFQASKVKFKMKVVRISQWLVGGWVVLALAIGLVWLVFSQMYELEKKKLSKTENAYTSLSSKLVTNQKLRYKVKLVSRVLGDRFEYAKAFRMVKAFLPSELLIKRLEIVDNSVFLADLESGGALAIDNLESRVKSVSGGGWPDVKEAKIKNIQVEGSIWKVGVEVVLK